MGTGEASGYADILIMAAIAVFILLRLRKELGRKDGTEDRVNDKVKKMKESGGVVQFPTGRAAESPVVQTEKPKEEEPPMPSYVSVVMDDVKRIDANFSAAEFLGGARMAFDMMLGAFNEGNRPLLKSLLTPDLYDAFCQELDRRQKENDYPIITLVSVKDAIITDAELVKNTVRITVEFISEQVHVTKNGEGKIIDGDPSDVQEMDDKWVFEKNLKASDPNWAVVSTDADG